MSEKVEGFVASGHGRNLLAAGLTADQVAQGHRDMMILLEASAAAGAKAFAMTRLADRVLHEVLDTAAFKTLVRKVWGEDAVFFHDGDAWGTGEYQAAWENSRAAFSERGILLSADPAGDGDRSGAFCLFRITTRVH